MNSRRDKEIRARNEARARLRLRPATKGNSPLWKPHRYLSYSETHTLFGAPLISNDRITVSSAISPYIGGFSNGMAFHERENFSRSQGRFVFNFEVEGIEPEDIMRKY